MPLADAIAAGPVDMVIPVGAHAVCETAKLCPHLAVLPAAEHLEICYDKTKTVAFAQSLGVPVPRTSYVCGPCSDLSETIGYPCVVKPARENLPYKRVDYCHSEGELRDALVLQLSLVRGQNAGVLVQEFIPGTGCGFFALMDHGRAVRVFMHERIREYPPSGGHSTAARSLYSARLKEIGLRLLSSLSWNGVAMVECKRDSRTGDYVLMEINGKFWGSLDLALSAGVNFGADLVRLFRGAHLGYCDTYDRDCHFYWPLDDDLLNLWETKSLSKVRDYWQPNARTNVGRSLLGDLWKTARLLKHLVQ
jgi:predicted ATP-grasp superfamily ATP-dependent carboligase